MESEAKTHEGETPKHLNEESEDRPEDSIEGVVFDYSVRGKSLCEPGAPKTRGDCLSMPRPCPYIGCRHHLAELGVLHPDASCALDLITMAEEGIAPQCIEKLSIIPTVVEASLRLGARRLRAIAGARQMRDYLIADLPPARRAW